MTREQILAADAVALSVEAHRILGRTIDPKWNVIDEASGGTFPALPVTEKVPNGLGLTNYADSWDDARELFEHELWPKDTTIILSYDPNADGVMLPWYYAKNERMGLMRKEHALPLLIARVFVLANGGTEGKK